MTGQMPAMTLDKGVHVPSLTALLEEGFFGQAIQNALGCQPQLDMSAIGFRRLGQQERRLLERFEQPVPSIVAAFSARGPSGVLLMLHINAYVGTDLNVSDKLTAH